MTRADDICREKVEVFDKAYFDKLAENALVSITDCTTKLTQLTQKWMDRIKEMNRES